MTPSFNQAEFVGATFASIAAQAPATVQYIVRDGGSSDTTSEVAAAWRHVIDRFESAPDGGQADAINQGFAETDGEIMAWLNSDDVLLPGAVAYVAEYFARHPDVDVVYGHRILIDAGGAEIGRWVLPRHDDEILKWADYVPQETLFWRRRAWDAVGGSLDETLGFAIDWDLILRWRDAGMTVRRLPRFLGCFRVHEAQKTSAEIAERGEREMMKLRQRAIGRPVDYPEINAAIRPYLRRHVMTHLGWRLGVLRY